MKWPWVSRRKLAAYAAIIRERDSQLRGMTARLERIVGQLKEAGLEERRE